MKKLFHFKKIKGYKVPPAAIIVGSVAFTVGINTPMILIFAHANVFGYWWFVLVLLYMLLFLSIYAFLIKPRDMARLRYMLGDEAFFELFPKELKREIRRLSRENAKHERELRG